VRAATFDRNPKILTFQYRSLSFRFIVRFHFAFSFIYPTIMSGSTADNDCPQHPLLISDFGKNELGDDDYAIMDEEGVTGLPAQEDSEQSENESTASQALVDDVSEDLVLKVIAEIDGSESNEEMEQETRQPDAGTPAAEAAPPNKIRVGVGVRVYACAGTLFNLLTVSDDQRHRLSSSTSDERMYGYVQSGSVKDGYQVIFDSLVIEPNVINFITKVPRNLLCAIQHNTFDSSSSSEDSAPNPLHWQSKKRPAEVQPKKRPAEVQPATTARRVKKKSPQVKIQRGGRVKVQKSGLFQLLMHQEQRDAMSGQPNNKNYYGTIVSGNIRLHYKIRFDEMPHGFQLVDRVRRAIIKPIGDGEEENAFDHARNDSSLPEKNAENESVLPGTETTEDFCSLPTTSIETAKVFSLKFGKEEDECIEWQIMADNAFIGPDEAELMVPDRPEFQKDFAFDPDHPNDFDFNKCFFKDFFPSIVGHAKIMDEYYCNPSAPYYNTVKKDNIRFHDSDNPEGVDWIVRAGYTIIIAASTEIHHGVDNLWKRGKSSGRSRYPDFGQYLPKNVFKAFLSAAPYCWCDKKHWYKPRDEKLWEIFLPCLDSFNEKRRNLVKVVLLMLDESMSGWRPKTSKLGGLPNYTYEPRKPIPLGTMFRNGVECLVGCLVHQDVVQLPEHQQNKKYHGEISNLPGRSQTIGAHTAEVLRQVENAGVVHGGWCGGDAWFGSIMTCVELKKRLGVNATFIVKNNHQMFPMKPLLAVLQARFGKRPAGHWVVFRATIAGVKLFALAYAWSQRGISYFVSTCGRTDPHPVRYRSNFEDDYGVTTYKELLRPHICHFLYEYLPLIDEHNKQRQSLLNLERCWTTKDCWMRLVTTIVGMSVVDFQRCFKNKIWEHRYGGDLPIGEDQEIDEFGRRNRNSATTLEDDEEIRIKQFADKICNWLDVIATRNRSSPRKMIFARANIQSDDEALERIRDAEGNITFAPTINQVEKHGRKVGKSIAQQCFMCRLFLNENGGTTYNSTNWRCKKCWMPLCKKDRTGDDQRRTDSCVSIHFQSEEEPLFCTEIIDNSSFVMPKSMQIEYIQQRRSARTNK
jgi:hypothetical protein